MTLGHGKDVNDLNVGHFKRLAEECDLNGHEMPGRANPRSNSNYHRLIEYAVRDSY